MRALLFPMLPVLLALGWMLFRGWISARARGRQAKVIQGRWRDVSTEAPPQATPAKPTRTPGRTTVSSDPLCGRRGVHFLLRIFGAEESCRRCAELRPATPAVRDEDDVLRAVEELLRKNEQADR